MRKSFILYVHTGSDLHRMIGYKTTIDENNDFITKGILTPGEYAFAKILRYIYERFNGWPKNFQLIDNDWGNIASPGMFGGLGGPTEIPTPDNDHNEFENHIIEDIKYRIEMRKKLINKVINEWNISSDGVKLWHGIEKYNKEDLC